MSKPGIFKDIMGTDLWIRGRLVIDPHRNINGRNTTAEAIHTDEICNISSSGVVITGNIVPCGSWNMHANTLGNVLNLSVDKIVSPSSSTSLEYGIDNDTDNPDQNIVIGYNNDVFATSTAVGGNNVAYAYSISLGFKNAAIGQSIAMGTYQTAVYDSVVLGGYNAYSGAYGQSVCLAGNSAVVKSEAVGYDAIAWSYSTALGKKSRAGSPYSFPYGAFSNRAVAIGANSVSNYNSLAIGNNAQSAICYRGISIGDQAGTGNFVYHSIAIGSNALAANDESVSLGANSKAYFWQNVSLGSHASSGNAHSVAIGRGSFANAEDSVAIGDYAVTQGWRSVAVGNGARSLGFEGIAIGDDALAKSYYYGYYYGYSSRAIAIGTSATAAHDSIAIGSYAYSVYTPYTVALGNSSYASGKRSIAIGNNSTSTYWNTIAIGRDSRAYGSQSIALGRYARTYGWRAVAIGTNSFSTDNKTVAVGDNAYSKHYNAIVLGVNGTSQAANRLHLNFPSSPLVGKTLTTANCLSIIVNGQEVQIPVWSP